MYFGTTYLTLCCNCRMSNKKKTYLTCKNLYRCATLYLYGPRLTHLYFYSMLYVSFLWYKVACDRLSQLVSDRLPLAVARSSSLIYSAKTKEKILITNFLWGRVITSVDPHAWRCYGECTESDLPFWKSNYFKSLITLFRIMQRPHCLIIAEILLYRSRHTRISLKECVSNSVDWVQTPVAY